MIDTTEIGETIRILIVDDHAVVREGLRWLISTEPGMELVGEATDGAEAVEKARLLHPDVILLDLVMPRKDGLEAIREIIAESPGMRILVLSSFAEDEKVFAAIKSGALGYMVKDSSSQDLMGAIRDVHRGEPSVDPTIAQKLMRELQRAARQPSVSPVGQSLTEREAAVLKLVAQGLSNRSIADKLMVNERTVRTHVSNILDKLSLVNRTQAALYALREGLVHLDAEYRDCVV